MRCVRIQWYDGLTLRGSFLGCIKQNIVDSVAFESRLDEIVSLCTASFDLEIIALFVINNPVEVAARTTLG